MLLSFLCSDFCYLTTWDMDQSLPQIVLDDPPSSGRRGRKQRGSSIISDASDTLQPPGFNSSFNHTVTSLATTITLTPESTDLTLPIDSLKSEKTHLQSSHLKHLDVTPNLSLNFGRRISDLSSNRSGGVRGRKRTHTQIFKDVVSMTPRFRAVQEGEEIPAIICLVSLAACISSKLSATASLFPKVEKLMQCDRDSAKLVHAYELRLEKARPFKAKLADFMYKNNRTLVADLIQSVLALISSALYIFETYAIIADNEKGKCFYTEFERVNVSGVEIPIYMCVSGTKPGNLNDSLLWIRIIETCFAVVFAVDYGIRFYIARNRFKYFFSMFPLVDLLTIVPVALSWYFGGSTSFGFARVVRLLRLLRVLKAWRLVGDGRSGDWTAIKQANILIFTVFSLLFVASGLIQMVEHNQGLTFGDSVYFMVVTMSTVGYGDISPQTSLGKLIMILVMITAIVLIPVQTRGLMDLLGEQPKERFKNMPSRENGFVILAGHHLTHDEIFMFVKEFYHPVHQAHDPPSLIVVSRVEMSGKLRLLLESQGYKHRMRFVLGSLLEDDTLRKIHAEKAKACFVLATGKIEPATQRGGALGLLAPRHPTESSDDIDTVTALQTLNFRSYSKYNVETYILLNHSAGKSTANAASADYIASLDESRLKLMAQSCICPGLSTLVINFITSFREASTTDRAKLRSNISESDEYKRGMSHVVYEMRVPSQLVGRNFIEAAIAVYMKFEITILGVISKRERENLGCNGETFYRRRQSTWGGFAGTGFSTGPDHDGSVPKSPTMMGNSENDKSGFNFILNPGHRYNLKKDDVLAVLSIDLATCEVCEQYKNFPLSEATHQRNASLYNLNQSASNLHLTRRRAMGDTAENRRRQDIKRHFKSRVWAIISLLKLRPVRSSLPERTVLDVNAPMIKYRDKEKPVPFPDQNIPRYSSDVLGFNSPSLSNLNPTLNSFSGVGIPVAKNASDLDLHRAPHRPRSFSQTDSHYSHAETELSRRIDDLKMQLQAATQQVREGEVMPSSPHTPDLLGASSRSVATAFTDGGHIAKGDPVLELQVQLQQKEALLRDLIQHVNPTFGPHRRTDWRREGVFKDHIIVTGGLRNLAQFMRALKRSLCATKTPLKTVLYLAPTPPVGEVWNRVSHYRYFYYCQGDPKLPNDLYRAGLEDASSLVVLASDGKKTDGEADADSVFIVMAAVSLCPVDEEATQAMVAKSLNKKGTCSASLEEKLLQGQLTNRKGMPILKRGNGSPLFICAELMASTSVKYFNDFDVLQASKSYGLNSKERMELRMRTDWKVHTTSHDDLLDEEVEAFSSAHQSSPFYSAGFLISNQMLGPILPHSYYSPSLIRIVEQFMQGSLNQYGSFLGCIAVPEILINKTYGELFYSMALKMEMIPLGLYRGPGGASKSPLPYVFTNPTKTTIVRENDLVYVLQSGKDVENEDSDDDSTDTGSVKPFDVSVPGTPIKPDEYEGTMNFKRTGANGREVHWGPTEPIGDMSATSTQVSITPRVTPRL